MAVIRQGYATLSAFPPTGLANIIYVDFSTGIEYVYTTSYILFTPTKASLLEGYKDSTWFTANPNFLLGKGQRINLLQTGTYKLGDGVTLLSALSFLGGGGSQTLAQTLVLGKKTNETVIESNNTYSKTSIFDAKNESKFDDGNAIAQTLNTAYQNRNYYDNGSGKYGENNITDLTNEIYHTDKVLLTSPLIEVGQDPTTLLGVVTKQYADTKEPAITPTTNVDFWSGAKTWLNFQATALGTLLLGYIKGAGTISASDSILGAIQKLDANDDLKEDKNNKATVWTVINDTLYPSVKNVDDQLKLKADKTVTNFKTANYDMVLTDVGKHIAMNLAVANTFTIKLNATVNCPIDAETLISQYGIGQTQILKDVGVTLISIGNADKIMAQGGAVAIKQVLTDIWFVWGALEQAGGSGLTQQIVEGLI